VLLPFNFLRRYSLAHLLKVLIEGYLCTLVRSWPGLGGMAMRYGVLKLTFDGWISGSAVKVRRTMVFVLGMYFEAHPSHKMQVT
jgi:hypothetical protein